MDKAIRKLAGNLSYFLGNVLVRIRVTFLPDCPLVLFLLKYKGIEAFLNQKNEEFKQGKPLKL